LDYKQLFKGVEYYNENYAHWASSYQRLRKRGDEYWLHLEKLHQEQIEDDIIGFLNRWKCRVSYQSAASLKQILENLPLYYAKMENEAIEVIDFDQSKILEKQHLLNSEMIRDIMKNFLTVRPKFGPVATSKLMHMAIPHLFMTWDTEIRSKYHIPNYYGTNHAQHYLRFLKLMQFQIKHAIDSYAKTHNIDARTAIREIRKKDDISTLPRIIDKYNFAIRDGKLKICNECYNKWLRQS